MSVLHLTSMLRRLSFKILALGLCYIIIFTLAHSHAEEKNYFPLVDGAKWEYTGLFSGVGNKQFHIRATMSVNGTILINSKRYFKFVVSGDFSGVPGVGKQIEDVRYYRITKDGIYIRPGNNPSKSELVEIPLPIPIGIKWLSGTAEAKAERAGTIKAGDHDYADCLKITYKASDGTRRTEYYLAPEVGVIKAIYVDISEPESVMELTLEEYQP